MTYILVLNNDDGKCIKLNKNCIILIIFALPLQNMIKFNASNKCTRSCLLLDEFVKKILVYNNTVVKEFFSLENACFTQRDSNITLGAAVARAVIKTSQFLNGIC